MTHMKARLFLAAAAALLCLNACYDDTELRERLEQVEKTSIPSIDTQVSNLKTSLSTLETMENELKGYISDLQKKDGELNGSLAELQQKDQELKTALETLQGQIGSSGSDLSSLREQLSTVESQLKEKIASVESQIETMKKLENTLSGQIKDLRNDIKGYVTAEISTYVSWAEKTFATAEQYAALVSSLGETQSQLQSLKTTVDGINSGLDDKIQGKIDASLVGVNAKAGELQENLQSLKTLVDGISSDIDGKINESLTGLKEQLGTLQTQIGGCQTQLGELQTRIQDVETSVDGFSTVINTKIGESTESIKTWVSGVLEGYCSSADLQKAVSGMDGKLGTLYDLLQSLDSKVDKLSEKIDELSGKLDKVVERIQSITFVPRYTDYAITAWYAYMDGVITPEQDTLDFKIRPAAAVAQLVAAADAVGVDAVYTKTRAGVELIPLSVKEVLGEGDILSVVFSGDGLSNGFFNGAVNASVSLNISDGNNDCSSNYVPLIPKVSSYYVSVKGIRLEQESIVLTVGDAITMVAYVMPEDATDKDVSWSSSDYDVASVGKSGKVTALGAGEAVITATCGEFSATCNVTVKAKEGGEEGGGEGGNDGGDGE